MISKSHEGFDDEDARGAATFKLDRLRRIRGIARLKTCLHAGFGDFDYGGDTKTYGRSFSNVLGKGCGARAKSFFYRIPGIEKHRRLPRPCAGIGCSSFMHSSLCRSGNPIDATLDTSAGARQHETDPVIVRRPVPSNDNECVRWTEAVRNARYNVAQVAADVGFSPRQLRWYFNVRRWRNPKQVVDFICAIDAAGSLLNGSCVKRAAADFGYHDSSHFHRAVRKHLGLSPTDVTANQIARIEGYGAEGCFRGIAEG